MAHGYAALDRAALAPWGRAGVPRPAGWPWVCVLCRWSCLRAHGRCERCEKAPFRRYPLFAPPLQTSAVCGPSVSQNDPQSPEGPCRDPNWAPPNYNSIYPHITPLTHSTSIYGASVCAQPRQASSRDCFGHEKGQQGHCPYET